MFCVQPNILYLHCHDAGRHVQPYHPAIKTPNIQRLAEEGVLFRNAFTINPTCSPSRACLLTGQNAHSNGMLGLAHRGFHLADKRRMLPWTLKAAGYTTILTGVQHVTTWEPGDFAAIGYDETPNHKGDYMPVTEAAEAFLAKPHDKPWFLDVGYFSPHRLGEGFPSLVRPDDPRFVQVPSVLPDTPVTRADMALYQASVFSTDICFGRVLEALEKSGQADNTLVICTTDHGIAFPHIKCNLTDHGTGVMLIVRGPGGFTGGKVIDSLVTHLDIFPTLCELLGIEPPAWLEGSSLMPLLDDPDTELHEAVFGEVNFHAAYEPKRTVRTRQWRYIRNFDGRDRIVLPNCDDSPSKTLLYQQGWATEERPAEYLFDLNLDPQERRNLAGDPRHAEILAELRKRLDEWMQATNDPLLAGFVAAPDGAVVNDPDEYSPGTRPQPMKGAKTASRA